MVRQSGSAEHRGGSLRLRHGLRVDRLGDECLVLDSAEGVVHSLRGEAAKFLDRVLRREAVPESEVLFALVRAGIVVGAGVTRRQLLGASGFTSALLVTSVLPTAAAAATDLGGGGSGVASIVGESSLVTSYLVTDEENVAYQLFRVAAEDFASSQSDVVRQIRLSAARDVDLLLVGGGGGGGDINNTSTFATGGGGAGEVHLVSLEVDANKTLLVTAGAYATPGFSGSDTSVSLDGTTIALARGGGRGSGADNAATTGGSGGGGRSSADAEERDGAGVGLAGTGGGDSDRFAGAAGGASGGGGGGGAGSAGSVGSSVGGAGGAAVDIAAFIGTWDGNGSNPLAHRIVAGGGGGGHVSAPGAGGAFDGVTVGGRGVRDAGEGELNTTGRHGVRATGSGGGGGAANGTDGAAGNGASGVVWIRVRVTA